MVPRIRDLYKQHAKYDYLPKLKIYVMMIKPNEEIKKECEELQIHLTLKP